MLSLGKSEYSRAMSSCDIPSARHDRINETENRVPRMVGFPPKRSRLVTRNRYPGIGMSSITLSKPITVGGEEARPRRVIRRPFEERYARRRRKTMNL